VARIQPRSGVPAVSEFLRASRHLCPKRRRRVQHWLQSSHRPHHDDEHRPDLAHHATLNFSRPAKPECCEGLWEDKSNPATNTGLDPILWTDQKTGRTFSSNSTVGANAVYGYTDNDGDLWVPFGIAAPNGGA
jgi:hypothetical protein